MSKSAMIGALCYGLWVFLSFGAMNASMRHFCAYEVAEICDERLNRDNTALVVFESFLPLVSLVVTGGWEDGFSYRLDVPTKGNTP